MAIKKSEIYSSLWASCDALRGGMDASQYKDYVLVLLFVKYVSDKYAGDPNGIIEVPAGGSFADMVALKGDKEIGEKINIIIAKLAEANDLKGVIDVADFNDPEKLGTGKEMVDRLSNLVAIFNRAELDFRKNRAEGDDILGDAYEYLMRHFATESGKSKGQFRGNAESEIRKEIIGKGYIKAIIGLPANLFYGTGIPACIVVLDKENAHARTGIFMVDASKGFVKDGNKNRLRAQDIHKIVDAFTRQLTLPRYSRMVPLAEIEKHDFNLNIPRYIDSSEPEDLQDIEAHLKGGIPLRDLDALGDYWAVLPSVRGALFGPGDRSGYATPKVEPAGVKPTILGHPEFDKFSKRVDEIFAGWRSAHIERLKGIAVGDKPKQLIEEIAEDLLTRFADVPLIDKYDVYQHLMTYWAEVMQDDVYIIAQEGWAAARQIRELLKSAEGKFTEMPDITIGRQKLKAELIPPTLIVARFFSKERAELEALEAKAEEISRAIEELDEEQGGEDGLLFEAKTEKGKLTTKSIKDRLKDIKGDKTADEERAALNACLKLIEQEKEASDAAKDAKTALDTKTVKHYAKLTDSEIKELMVEDKWYASLQDDVEGELDRVSQELTGRVKLLTERYEAPLAKLAESVGALQAKVDAHLKRMGFMT